MVSIEKQAKHWDSIWGGRITADGVKMNNGKFNVIMNFLWNRPIYFKKRKLDVGCGPAMHSQMLAKRLIGWRESWHGIDLSPVAVETARRAGLQALCADFLTLETTEKFEVFMFWDTLEHFEDLAEVAARIRALSADDKPYVLGNIPLYLSPADENTGAVEHYLSVYDVKKFTQACGCPELWKHVYGVNGLPYLLFEAYDPEKKQKDEALCLT